MVGFTKTCIGLAAMASFASCHPGHDATQEIRERSEYLASLENVDIAHCASKLAKRGHMDQTIERRRNMLKDLRVRRGLDVEGPHHRVPRQLTTVLSKTHKSSHNFASSPMQADWALLGQNRSSVLTPDQTEGPYYVAGEFVRKDITEGQKGIPLHLDIQIVDMNNCSPIPGVALDLWHANATGVYSGVAMFGNGNINDKSNLNNKALRGIQVSGKNGEVQYETIVPGHYMGRTHHIHVLSHLNATVMSNNTIKGGNVAHVGQLYFDQDLVDAVEKLPPYATNNQPWMKNADDWTMASGAINSADPVMEYVMLGKKLEDGIFAWINFGIDSKKNRKVMAAVECTSDGCKSSGFFGLLTGLAAPKLIGNGAFGLGNLIGGGFAGLLGFGAPPTAARSASTPSETVPSAVRGEGI